LSFHELVLDADAVSSDFSSAKKPLDLCFTLRFTNTSPGIVSVKPYAIFNIDSEDFVLRGADTLESIPWLEKWLIHPGRNIIIPKRRYTEVMPGEYLESEPFWFGFWDEEKRRVFEGRRYKLWTKRTRTRSTLNGWCWGPRRGRLREEDGICVCVNPAWVEFTVAESVAESGERGMEGG
jgi:hypothetical protein